MFGREVMMTNATGIVCLGSEATNCAGPAELLSIRNIHGKAIFEIRGASAVPAAQRQGFFEFDVEIQ